MKVSQIGLISKKITSLDSQFPVQDMLIQTGQLNNLVAVFMLMDIYHI